MVDKQTKMLEEAYMVVNKQFNENDQDIPDDNWWWEEGRYNSSSTGPQPNTEPNYTTALQQHKIMAPRPQFNAYEQCNKIILSCDSMRQVMQHFCRLVDSLTKEDENAQQKVIEFVQNINYVD